MRTVQLLWLVCAVAAGAAWGAGTIPRWQALAAVCQRVSQCNGFQLSAASARALGERGISPVGYAVYTLAVLAIINVVWYGLGALIIWRKPDDRGAIVAAFFLLVFPLTSLAEIVPSDSLWGVVWFVAIPAFPLFGLLFPDGRFVPRWTRWLAVVCVVTTLLTAVVILPLLLALVAVVVVQIYRFRSVFTFDQRQQAKWAFFGLILGILGLVALITPAIAAPTLVENGSLYSAFTGTAIPLATSAIPVSIAIAVLRNHLWDIDRVINRALVYITLSALLAGIYIGCVIGLQAIFGLIAGHSSSLAIALSTLAIAALFGPLRRRVQRGIDRRFFRSKYDAQKTLATFGERLRDEVDLAQLSTELTSVVSVTLHPEHASLWLLDGGHASPTDRGETAIDGRRHRTLG